jgi:hypothetical protein
MSERANKRLRLGLLFFALVFTVIALLQYQFTKWELRRTVTSQLASWAEELRDAVVGHGKWQPQAFRNSAPAAPDYLIVTRDGLLVDVEGFAAALLPNVSSPAWPADDQPHAVKSAINEDWTVLSHKVRGGLVVLGIPSTLGLSDAEERLRTNAAHFGSDLSHAAHVGPRRIDSLIDYAVIDDGGHIRTMWGGVPLQMKPEAVARMLSMGPIVDVGKATYQLHTEALFDATAQPLGTVVVLKDISGEEALRRQAFAFNGVIGVLSWIAVGGLFAYYVNSFRSPNVSCDQAYAGEEGQKVEFKSSFRWDYNLQKPSKDIEGAVIKTVAAFLNTEGGVLLIGVDNNKVVLGLEPDYASLKTKPNRDGWELALQQAFMQAVGADLTTRSIDVRFCSLDGKDVCIVRVSPARHPVFVAESTSSGQRREAFYVRMGNATRSLEVKDALAYASERWGA